MSANQRTFNFSYIPLILILLTAIILLGMFLAGGMVKVIAWNLAVLPISIVAINGLVFTIRRWIIQKRLDLPGKVTGAAVLLAFSPVLMVIYPVPYPASLQDTQPSVTVRLPADVPLKVVWGGDTLAVNQHVVVPDQRWAYDLVVEPYLTGSTKVTDYGCYGVPVVAPAAGEVVIAHDGEQDMVPGESSNNYKAPEGNHVAIRLDETDTYLVIAHLKPGSVAVASGQHVTEGQVIGQCGNSGNTSEPHIHLHHQRQDPTIYPINFAEGLPLYFRDLDGPMIPQGGVEFVDGMVVATGDLVVYRNKP